MSRSPGSYSWLPGFLRRFLNLDDEMPSYGPSSSQGSSYSAPSSRPAFYTPPAPSYTPPAPSYTPSQASDQAPEAPRFAPTFTPSEQTTPRFASTYTPPAGPPAPAPRVAGAEPAPPASVTPGANLPGGLPEGYVQPIGYLLRSFARGALPPQGLEQFTRETRATSTDVWNFYSYWTRFQTEEFFRIGRELFDTLFEDRPGAEGAPSPGSQSIRRIKVTTGNGNGHAEEKKVERVATTTTIDPPPAPTPAAPPTPPAPTAAFSPTVTADDAAVPPGGAPVAREAFAPPEPPAPPAAEAPAPEPPAATPPTTPPTTPGRPASQGGGSSGGFDGDKKKRK